MYGTHCYKVAALMGAGNEDAAMSDLAYSRITGACLVVGLLSAFMYDHGFHATGLALLVIAGTVSTVVWFREGHR
jgi:hypothetical protein